VRAALALLVVAGSLSAPAPSVLGAGAARPRVALSASPARVAVVGPAARAIVLRNVGAEPVVVDAARAPLDPRSARRRATTWIRLAPKRLALGPGASGILTMRVTPPAHARPGDHHALVLLTTRPLRGARVAVRMRLGVVVQVRVPGPIARRLELRGLRVLRHRGSRVLVVSVANRGNVTEELRGRVAVLLVRGTRVVARLRCRVRNLLPGTRGKAVARYGGRVRGLIVAVVEVRRGSDLPTLRRMYRIRL
jgi:hypothetical protein